MAGGLKFQNISLGRLEKGSTVVVELSRAANVRLMTPANVNAFKSNRRHQMAKGSGLVKTSPHRIVVPSTGRWHFTVDLIGLKPGTVTVRHHVEPAPPPIAKSAPVSRPAFTRSSDLSTIRHVPQAEVPQSPSGRRWDVFISHASEDKADVAAPLKEALEAQGLEVWLDVANMRIGDSLRRKIDDGLAHSAFGVVVLSPSYFDKGWPQYELDGIIGRTVSGEQQMLPIWHGLTKDEVQRRSPSLADKLARSTATHTVAEIADEIAAVVKDTANGEDSA